MNISGKSPIESLIFVTASLIDIMTREIELLKNMQPQQIRELQQEKTDLARAYETYMNRIKAEPQILLSADSSIKRQLKELTAKFQAVLAENERALRAVKSVSERLLNVIINTLAEKQNGAAYSATGALGNGTISTGGRGNVSLTVDQRL